MNPYLNANIEGVHEIMERLKYTFDAIILGSACPFIKLENTIFHPLHPPTIRTTGEQFPAQQAWPMQNEVKTSINCAQSYTVTNGPHRMTRHINRISIAVKSAHAWSDQYTAPESAESSDHMHHSRASKVNESGIEEVSQPIPSIAHPAVLGPDPMGNDGVYPGRDDKRVA